jgi:hypothetical protein
MNGLSSAIKWCKECRASGPSGMPIVALKGQTRQVLPLPLCFELPNDIRQALQLKGAVPVSRTVDEAICL